MTSRSASQAGQAPLALERLEEPDEVARRRGELGRRDLDVVEADDRVDDEVADRQALADDLAVDLALGRDVDDHVAAQVGGARQAAALGEALLAVVLGLALGRRGQVVRAGRDPVLGERPDAGTTWQRPQSPRPPQTESMSTPSARAASRTVVPSANRPRRPDGVKMTSASAALGGLGGGRRHGRDASAGGADEPAVDAAAAGLALGRRLAVRPDPAAAVGVVAHQDVGRHDRPLDASAHRVRDRRRQAAAIAIGRNARVDPLAVRQAEADVATRRRSS